MTLEKIFKFLMGVHEEKKEDLSGEFYNELIDYGYRDITNDDVRILSNGKELIVYNPKTDGVMALYDKKIPYLNLDQRPNGHYYID